MVLASLVTCCLCFHTQIALLKPKFGFIKCCERRTDLFFHFAALVEGLAGGELQVGDDVEFSVGSEPPSEERSEPRTVALRWVLGA